MAFFDQDQGAAPAPAGGGSHDLLGLDDWGGGSGAKDDGNMAAGAPADFDEQEGANYDDDEDYENDDEEDGAYEHDYRFVVADSFPALSLKLNRFLQWRGCGTRCRPGL
jgi:hypothetical protein